MSKIQKAAWFNLAMCTICVMVTAILFMLMASMNTKGLEYILIFVVVAVLLTPGLYVFYRKRSFEASFDEREKTISGRALVLSSVGLTIFLGCACIIPFFLFGGQAVIRVYYLPLVFFSTLLVAQFVHSVAILMWCSMEDEHGQ